MYKLQPNGGVLRSDGLSIPGDENNTDYRDFLAWVANGNTPDPARTLEEKRALLWVLIKAERDRRKSTGAQAGDYWFHTDPDSRIQQLGLYTVAVTGGSAPSTMWKTMSGVFLPLSNQLALDVFAAVVALDINLFTHAETLRAQVNASSEPESIDPLAGWPQNYEESL